MRRNSLLTDVRKSAHDYVVSTTTYNIGWNQGADAAREFFAQAVSTRKTTNELARKRDAWGAGRAPAHDAAAQEFRDGYLATLTDLAAR